MSDHYSIYCESVAVLVNSLLKQEKEGKISRVELLKTLKMLNFESEMYLLRINLLIVRICCKNHLLMYGEEGRQLKLMIELLDSGYENIKSVFAEEIYPDKHSEDTVH